MKPAEDQRRTASIAACVLIAWALSACAARSGSKQAQGSGGAGGGGTGGSANAGVGANLGAGPNIDVEPEAPVESPGCSADLHQVLNENGQVSQTCPSDRACSGSQCVPVCTAFAALRGSVGCDFFTAAPSVMTLYKPGCLAVFVANAWNQNAKLSVSRAGKTLDLATFGRVVGSGSDAAAWAPLPPEGLGPDQVAVLFLSSDPEANSGDGTDTTCPVTPAVLAPGGAAVYGRSPQDPKDKPAQQTGLGQAFRISSDGPVSLYSILPYGGAKSVDPGATLLYPTAVWGKNYVAVVPPQMYPDEFTSRWGQILASVDNTKIDLVPTSNLPAGGGVAGAPRGVTATFRLDAGQFIQWQDSGEITGTVILADQPIAFIGGASPLGYDSSLPECENGATDNAYQQIPPVAALGSEYVAAPYHSRISIPEVVPYRIVGFVDGTKLVYDPPQPNAPSSLERAETSDFLATGPFVVRSQDADHPFYVAEFMTGCGKGTPTGDEEFVNVIPSAQFLTKYVFFTDPTYSTTNLVMVRKKASGKFRDVSIDCLGVVSGWKDVGTDGKYQIADADLIRLGVSAQNCTNGRHVANSEGPFGLVVWGLDNWASYAYPAGGGAIQINDVVVPPVVK